MSSYKKTIVIGCDYSEFSGGISECNRKMGLLDAEMKLAQEKAKAYGDETDQLKIKQEGLSQKIELQKVKVQQQAKAYDEAMSSGKKNEKQVDALDKALLESRTTLQKLENEYKDTNEQLEKFKKRTDDSEDSQRSFGDVVRDVADTIGINANPIVEKFAEKFDDVDANVGKAILTIGTLTSTLAGFTLKTADHAKEIVNVSQTMGMTTDQYQVWDYILQSVGYDAESASGDLAALAEKAKDAAEGGDDSAKMFRSLGISLRDNHGHLKSQHQLFLDLVNSLKNMEDTTRRNAIASDLLSTTGEKIIPILNMTTEEFNALKDSAYESGYVMSKDTLDGFSQLNGAMTEFKGSIDGLSNKFGLILLPILTDFFNAISAIPTPVLEAMIIIAGMVGSVVAIAKAVDSTLNAFDSFKLMLGGVDAKTIKTTGIILGVVGALIALAAIIAVIMGKSDDLNRTMDNVGSSIGKISKNVQGSSNVHYNATGTDYFEGGETWVGEDGPELAVLPRGSRIIPNKQSKSLGGDIYNITINAKADDITSIQRIINLAKQEKLAMRAGMVRV